jgi:DHA2 family multidrug resistance protein-like MFS transporter
MLLSFGPWPWLYAVNLPIGACVLMAARALPSKKGSGRPLDPLSAAISMGMFASFVLGAENVQSNPMAALGLFIGAALTTVILMRRESRRTDPLIPLDLLRQSSFRVSLVASVLCFVGQTAALVALPYYLQEGFGLSPFMTALHMLPWPLAVAATGPLSGRIADRVQTAMLCVVGCVLLAIGLGSAALVPIHGPQLAVGVSMLLCGVGFSLFNVSNNRNLFLSAPRERSGTAGGLQSVARSTGQTLGAVLMTILLAAYPLGSAPRVGLAIAALLTLAAGVTSTMRVGGKANQPNG